MCATGICFDNSPPRFFASIKRELVHRRRFATRAEARHQIIRWIEGLVQRTAAALLTQLPEPRREGGPLRTYARPSRFTRTGGRVTDCLSRRVSPRAALRFFMASVLRRARAAMRPLAQPSAATKAPRRVRFGAWRGAAEACASGAAVVVPVG